MTSIVVEISIVAIFYERKATFMRSSILQTLFSVAPLVDKGSRCALENVTQIRRDTVRGRTLNHVTALCPKKSVTSALKEKLRNFRNRPQRVMKIVLNISNFVKNLRGSLLRWIGRIMIKISFSPI